MPLPTRWREAAAGGRARFEGLRATAERRLPVLTELTARLLSANLLESGTRVASQAFLTAVPLLFVVAAFAPQGFRQELMGSLRSFFGLSGSSDEQLKAVLTNEHGSDLRETTGIVGILMALVSATSFSRAVARVCERAWQLPRGRARVTVWRWAAWLVMLVGALLVLGSVRNGLGAGVWLGVPLGFLLGVGVWWWTQHLLLASRVAWLPLLPGAVLTSAASSALGLTARLYIPNAVNRSLSDYGSLGLVLTLLSWLIVICVAVSATITVGAVLAQEPPLFRLLSGGRPAGPVPPAGAADG